jgi:hypothetical protein
MTAFLYRCPTTGYTVQGLVPDRPTEFDNGVYEAITCTACRAVHLVNPTTGHVVGIREKPGCSDAQ